MWEEDEDCTGTLYAQKACPPDDDRGGKAEPTCRSVSLPILRIRYETFQQPIPASPRGGGSLKEGND